MKQFIVASTLCLIALEALALSSAAWAGSDPGCDKLPKGDKVACAAKAKTDCASVEGYWPKRKCEAKIAQGFNLCMTDGVFEAMCVKRKAAYWDVCMKAGELDMNKPETLPEFKRRALAFSETLRGAKEFEQEWGACFRGNSLDGVSCAVTEQDLMTCERAGGTYKKTMKSTMDWYLKTTMPQTLSLLDTLMASKHYSAASSSTTEALKTLSVLRSLNHDLPHLAYREAELVAATKKFGIIAGIITKTEIQAIASVRCPKGRNNKKSLVKKMRGSVNNFFGHGDYAKKVKVMRLNGKKSVKHNAYKHETTESYPAYACTKGLPTSQAAGVCNVFNISVKRTRFKRKAWGPWTTFVGHSQTMLCKNLK